MLGIVTSCGNIRFLKMKDRVENSIREQGWMFDIVSRIPVEMMELLNR